VRQDSSFAEKQEPHPALVLVVRCDIRAGLLPLPRGGRAPVGVAQVLLGPRGRVLVEVAQALDRRRAVPAGLELPISPRSVGYVTASQGDERDGIARAMML
jgi:hypothetical protein